MTVLLSTADEKRNAECGWLAGCDEAIALFFLAVIVGHGDLAFLGGLRLLCRGFCFCEMAHCIVSGFKAANRERGEQNPSPLASELL
jgi:hypothetical protein